MPRALIASLSLIVLVGGLVPASPAWAGDGAPGKKAEEKAKPIPALATGEEVAEALAAFKKAFKAKGMKGDEKLAEQDWAIRQLAEVQHPKVVDALVKLTKHRSEEIRTSAVIQLGAQRRIPGYAGHAVGAAMKRHGKDATMQMAGLAAIANLRYLGATEIIQKLMGHHDYAVKKNALVTIGKLEDHRFIDEIVKLMKALKLEKGASWDGVEVNYDTGASGDSDQKMAEKLGKAAAAKNKKKGRGSARSQRDIGPVVLELMFDLTGEQFTGGIAARKWLGENRKHVDTLVGVRKAEATAQATEAKASRKLR